MSNLRAYQQALLCATDGRTMRVWIDAGDWRVIVGSWVTLKDIAGQQWKVLELSEMSATAAELYKPWRVGGLV